MIHVYYIGLFDVRLPESDLKRSKHVGVLVKYGWSVLLIIVNLLFLQCSLMHWYEYN
jgi:hypothetical protein